MSELQSVNSNTLFKGPNMKKEDVLNTSFSFPVIEKGWNFEALLGFDALIFLAAYFSQVCKVLKESISSCL